MGLVQPDLVPAEFNMAAYCIGQAARATPHKIALLVFDVTNPSGDGDAREAWTYSELERSVLGLAGALAALGLQRGDRVAIHLGNSSGSALLFFAAIAGGYIALPLSDQLTPRELRGLLDDSGAAVIATSQYVSPGVLPPSIRVLSAQDIDELTREALKPRIPASPKYAETAAGDPAFLIYTSGTTAKPKGVLHAHRSAWGRRPMYEGWYGMVPEDRMLHAGAFNWTYTLGVGLTDPWANGATSIIYTGEKKPEHWPRIIAHTGATLFAAVPGVYRQILKYAAPSPDAFGRLRHGLVAGETPPSDLFEDWRAATGRDLYEALGMSEISTYISTSPSVPRKSGMIGKPQAGRRVAILPVDGPADPLPSGHEGLIAVHRSDPALMLGYWNRKDEEAEVVRGDWFTGGDLGLMDEDGYIAHLGRANELMNAGGYRVSPLEIETVLAGAPGVAEVACAEIEVKAGVHVIAAFVVRTPGVAITPQSLLEFAKVHLAAFKCPKQIVFVDHLPRTTNGKLQRKQLTSSAFAPHDGTG